METIIRARIETCPGGVAVVVPAAVAARAGLRGGESAELELSGGCLAVRPAGPRTLAELMAGVTADNLHGEWAAGPAAGSVADAFGGATVLRSGDDILSEMRADRDEWGDR